MPNEARPVLSVIVRRFQHEFEDDFERAVKRIQQAVADQPGFVGLQNSLSHGQDYDELVTVFAFDSRENLEKWESSPVRERFVEELDVHSHGSAKHTQFGDLALLLHPNARLRKIETVAILIFWIVIIGGVLRYLADFLLPATFPPMWRHVLLISVNVVLISYLFLPWSSMMLTKLKARISKRVQD